jgi:FkbM family methyltransferase
MKFVSYAQNYEDVMLWRALHMLKDGFYIDVGAADPIEDSVTYAFYERGWHGLNVEPEDTYFKRLNLMRPRDVNVRLAAGEHNGTSTLYVVTKGRITGLSTLDEALAQEYAANGYGVEERRIEVTSLAEMCERYCPSEIQFLKIDAEGSERAVLAGADFRLYRPWIVLVEATKPMTDKTNHAEWESLLSEAQYRFAWFDGLNRFYLAEERHADLAPFFQTPPNVFDKFRKYERGPAFPRPLETPDGLIDGMLPEISPEDRIVMTATCRDADSIPKVPDAGSVRVEPDGTRIQIMHNGLKVLADGYYGPWMTNLIKLCRGHHEPQEERIFHEVLRFQPPTGAMLELGGYWSFYSLWFLQNAPRRRAIVVEPDPAHRVVGTANAKLNGLELELVSGFIGRASSLPQPFRTESSGLISLPCLSVPELMEQFNIDVLDILHCDTQGAELSVLESCEDLFRERRIKWVFVSTHSYQITKDPLTHQRCLALLRRAGAIIEAEHDVHESFSGDGLIVARFGSAPTYWAPVELSRNRYSESLFRNPLYDWGATIKKLGAQTREEIEEVVAAAYRAILLREPDREGLNGHTAAIISNDHNIQQIMEDFFRSPEFKARYGEFAKKYVNSTQGNNPDPRAMRYLQNDSEFACSGFRLEIKRDGVLGRSGETLLVPVDDLVLPGLLSKGFWQMEHIRFIQDKIDESCCYTLVDIGANIGLFSRQVLNSFSNIVECLCVEPDRENFAALSYNLHPYVHRNIRLFNAGLSDIDGTMKFYRDLGNIGNYSLNEDAMRGREFETTSVPTTDTTRWVSETLAGCDNIIWKSDTQGQDELILSCVPLPIWAKVRLAIIELWRIRKPDFDSTRFAERVDNFTYRSIGGKNQHTTQEVLDYCRDTDWHHEDLYLWQ